MTKWEERLSPIARDRLARIGELTQAEREQMLDSERVNSVLSEFHRGQIGPEGLWKKLKEEARPSLLKEAQLRLMDSLSLGTPPVELQRKMDAILAIESLKEEQRTSAIEPSLNLIKKLQKKHKAEEDQAYNAIRAEVERNPRLRVKQVQQGPKTMVVQLTVDEAIKQLPQWRDFLADQEKRYSQELTQAVERLERELR